MQVNIPGPVVAGARHFLTFSMGAIAATAGMHVISQNDANSLTAAIQNIANGVQSIVGGVGVIVAIVSGWYSAYSATRTSRINAVASDPTVKQITTTPEVAANIPSNKVIGQ